jgi:hypothetical protein
MFNKRILMGAAIALILGALPYSSANAIDQEVEASINAKTALALTKNADMNFGIVEFVATHSGTIRLGTNGTIDLTLPVGITMDGTPAAGDVDISASDGSSNVEISCDTGGTLAEPGADTLTLSATEISMDVGDAGGAADDVCAGVGVSPFVHTLDGTDKILVGGSIVVDGNDIGASAAYSTTTGAGVGMTLRVLYQ